MRPAKSWWKAVARTWGNVSARISDTQFVITPSGRAYETLTPEEVVVVNIEDCSYEGDIKPSSEKGVHAAAYRHHPTVDFVIHTHQKAATIVSITGMEIRNIYNFSRSWAIRCPAPIMLCLPPILCARR